ncbi:MAG: endonuclease III [Thermodesulfobacteriota bacterium]
MDDLPKRVDRLSALEILHVFEMLRKEYPDAKIALSYRNPLELMVATILSAQCTDERVNKVTVSLFKKYPTVESYARASLPELEEAIRSAGFFRNKARNIKACCELILEKFGGRIPQTMDELITLPGVARKTANIVLSNAFGIVEGIAVDTHVRRLAYRLGFTIETDPDKIEKDLMAVIPQKYWFNLSYVLIDHGRRICKARAPGCKRCVVRHLCPSSLDAGQREAESSKLKV